MRQGGKEVNAQHRVTKPNDTNGRASKQPIIKVQGNRPFGVCSAGVTTVSSSGIVTGPAAIPRSLPAPMPNRPASRNSQTSNFKYTDDRGLQVDVLQNPPGPGIALRKVRPEEYGVSEDYESHHDMPDFDDAPIDPAPFFETLDDGPNRFNGVHMNAKSNDVSTRRKSTSSNALGICHTLFSHRMRVVIHEVLSLLVDSSSRPPPHPTFATFTRSQPFRPSYSHF